MHLLSSLQLPLASFFGFEPWVIAIVIPICGLIFAAVMGGLAMHFKNQERARWHETARLALEKGQPLPPSPEESLVRVQKEGREDLAQHDVRGGLVLIAVGVGLWLLLGAISPPLRFVGAIPGLIGVALLLYATGRALFIRKPSNSDLRPPQS